MKYAIDYLKHHKSELDKMVADGTNTEADREWWAKLSSELETAIQRLLLLQVSGSVCDFCEEPHRVEQHNICERCRILLGD